MIAITTSFVRLQIILSIPTCRYGRPSSPRSHAVKIAYSTRVTVVTAAVPNIAFAGARPPSKLPSHSLTLNLEHTIVIDPYLRHGNHACGAGANVPPPCGRQGNHRSSGPSNHRPRYTNNRGHNPTYQGNSSGIPRAHVTADARNSSQWPHHIPQTPITPMRRGPGTTGAQPTNNHIHAPPYGKHSRTP